MGKALPETKRHDWRHRMSDHVAYAMLVYTGLQIFVTVGAMKDGHGSMLPYIGLVLLVAAIIPAYRAFERRWDDLSDDQAADPAYERAFKRDRLVLWIASIGIPLAICGLFKLIALVA